MKIRLATLMDIVAITHLMKEHREEVGVASSLVFEENRCIEGLRLAIGTNHSIVLVAVDASDVIGYMWLNIVEPHFCKQYYASEQYLYVTPKKRDGRALLLFIKEAKRAALLSGCEFLQLGVTSGLPTVERTYTKRFTRVGSVFNVDIQD